MTTVHTMDDIDEYLKKLHEQHEIEDFINNGIFPSRLQIKHKYKYVPPLDDCDILNEQHDDILINNYITRHIICDNLNHIKHSLYKLETELRYTTERENDRNNIGQKTTITTNEETNINCPICMEKIEDRNYIIPKCGHKTCINCFVSNVVINHDTQCGNSCSLCREIIF